MKRIVCVALSALLCCVGSVEAEKQQLHNKKGVVSVNTDIHEGSVKTEASKDVLKTDIREARIKQPLRAFILILRLRQTM